MKKFFCVSFPVAIMIMFFVIVNVQSLAEASNDTPVLRDICYGNDRFVGIDKGKVYLSADGDKWHLKTLTNFDGSRVYFDGLQFIVLDNEKIWRTRDVRNWKYEYVKGKLNDIVYGNSLYVAVGHDGLISISNDSINWDSKKNGKTAFNAVVWTGSKFVAVGDAGTVITSDDGKSWFSQRSGVSFNLKSICWNGSKLLVVGENNSIITSDAQGSNWTETTVADLVVNNFNKIVWTNSKFYLVGPKKIFSSANGSQWRLVAGSLSDSIISLATNGKKYLAIDYNGEKVYESDDEFYWKVKTLKVFDAITSGDNSIFIKSDAAIETIANEIEVIGGITREYHNKSKSDEELIRGLESRLTAILGSINKISDTSKLKDILSRVTGSSKELISAIDDSDATKSILKKMLISVVNGDVVYKIDQDKDGNSISGEKIDGGTRFTIGSERIPELTLKIDTIMNNYNEIKGFLGELDELLGGAAIIKFEVESSISDGIIELELPWMILKTISEKGIQRITVKTVIGEVVLNSSALKKDNSNVLIKMQYLKNDSFKGDAFSFGIMENGKEIEVFEDDIQISIPYQLKKGELSEDITVFCVDEKGEKKNISGIYDSNAKNVKFLTRELNTFVVGSNPVKFSDLDGNWAAAYISALASKGIINGTGNGMVNPRAQLTRAEFVTMICNSMKIEQVKAVSAFKDVGENDWFAPFVAAGYQNGLLSGYVDGTFKPKNPVTREEMAAIISKILVKYLNKKSLVGSQIASGKFEDFASINHYAVDPVSTAYKYGIIKGNNGKFMPKDKTTRAEAAAVIYKLLMMKYYEE